MKLTRQKIEKKAHTCYFATDFMSTSLNYVKKFLLSIFINRFSCLLLSFEKYFFHYLTTKL